MPINSKYEGSYRQVPKVDLSSLRIYEASWSSLYPINNKGNPENVLTPRQACKLFHCGLSLLDQSYANPQFMLDKLPEMTLKYYNKKQWQINFLECGKRILCRLAKGMCFSPNCTGEELFAYILVNYTIPYSWVKFSVFLDVLPASDKDRDFSRVTKLLTNEDLGLLYQTDEDLSKKGIHSQSNLTKDIQAWFAPHYSDSSNMSDHRL